MRVYLSSTYKDLVACRQAVYHALRKMELDVVAMEDYVASDERPVDKCVADAKSCDVYVGILGWRYGYIPPGYERSITELEFRAATEAGAHRLLFLVAEDTPWPRNQVEQGTGAELIQRLRDEVQRDLTVAFFGTPDELALQVVTALHQLISESAELRGDAGAPGDPGVLRKPDVVVNLPPAQVARFCDRERQRAELSEFLADSGVRMTSVVGRGGIGKSALAARVLSEAEHSLRTADAGRAATSVGGILYLSSRSTGLGLERIYADARRMLEHGEADQLAESWSRKDATLTQNAETLVEHLSDARLVVMFDGLETTLSDDGTIADDGLRAFVEACLLQPSGPRLVVTSRIDVLVPPETLPAVRVIRLERGLGTDDAVTLLKALDPQGDLELGSASDEDLKAAAELSAGIPRALEVLAGILQRDRSMSLHQLVADERTLGGRTVEALIAEGYRRLGETEQRVMQAMAVFAKPVGETAIGYVVDRWLPGADIRTALRRLIGSYFVTASRGTGLYTLQPLDQAHAYSQIAAAAVEPSAAAEGDPPPYTRANAELRAAEFYAGIRKPAGEWRSIDDVAPQLSEFGHRVRGGDIDGALEVLDPIDQQYLFLWGHYLRIIELRRSVLGLPARANLCAANLGSLALSSQVLGQYDAAIEYYEGAVAAAGDSNDAQMVAEYGGNLGRLYRNLGYMDKAVKYSQEALAAAKGRGDGRGESFWSDRLALAIYSLGQLDDADALFQRAIGLAQQLGDRRGEGAARGNQGLVEQARGNGHRADECYSESLAIGHEIGDLRGECIMLGRLGTVAHDAAEWDKAIELHTKALELAQQLSERREQGYQLLGIGRAELGKGDRSRANEHLRAARALETPEISYQASLALGLSLLPDRAAAGEAFADAVVSCQERLGRCDRLWAARYALGTAMAAHAGCQPDFTSRLSELLAPALEEYRRAVGNCSGWGAITAAVVDVRWLRVGGLEALEPVVTLLESAAAAAGQGPQP